jgi:predicted SAM-dependent methyltransferase
MEMVGEPVKIKAGSLELLPDMPPFDFGRLNELGLRGLHCGSGLNFHQHWLNTDRMRLVDPAGHSTGPSKLACIDRTHYYLEHNHTKPLPLTDGVFEWAYSEHFIEHISLSEAVQWLSEIRRLLKVGGFLRLSTPDLRRYTMGYLDPSNDFFAQHRHHLLSMGIKEVPTRPAWMLNQIFQFWGHKWIYDLDEICTVAVAAGFSQDSIVKCGFRQGQVPEVFALDLPIRSDESLYVEIHRT